MRLDLDEISAGGVVREYSFPVENFVELQALAKESQFFFTSILEFRLNLQRAGSLVELDGSLEFSVKEVCGRCLSPFEDRITSTFSLTFTPQKKADPEQEELELETEELGLVFYEGTQIDLHDALLEQVIISLPIGPLCKEGCLGLCMECGQDLNVKSCDCEKKLFNNKFATLKNLKLDS